MRQAPLLQDGSGHGGGGAGPLRCIAIDGVAEQPLCESFRTRILSNGPLKKGPLDRQADRVGRLVALALSLASFRGFERSEHRLADAGRAKRLVGRSHALTLGPSPSPCRRWYTLR